MATQSKPRRSRRCTSPLAREFRKVSVFLPHAYNTATTGLQSCRAHILHSAHTILIRMCGANLAVKSFTRIEIMIHPAHTGFFELSCLPLIHNA